MLKLFFNLFSSSLAFTLTHLFTHVVAYFPYFFRTSLLKLINCTIPGIEKFLDGSSLGECTDQVSAGHTFDKFLQVKYDFATNYLRLGCARSCTESEFTTEALYFHRNSWIETTDQLTLPEEAYRQA